MSIFYRKSLFIFLCSQIFLRYFLYPYQMIETSIDNKRTHQWNCKHKKFSFFFSVPFFVAALSNNLPLVNIYDFKNHFLSLSKKGVNDEVENNNTIHFDQFTAAITYNTIKSHWIIIDVVIDRRENKLLCDIAAYYLFS